MAPSRPARAVAQEGAVIDVANVKAGGACARTLSLRVAFEAQVRIALNKHLGVDGTVRVMADGAAFPERGMLENERTRLFPVTLRAILVFPRHGQTARGLHDIHPVRIVALHAAHFAFND